ncbi:unnamed protein product [Prorocentrum cordatum]|uniref:Uncharacterized protein n=1 Tax=Prorocentrum cordatum TaxID=2364126 RepID=A0ABN9TT72_9DINO|nr:unnamed protein product [Polarella glacialis]
MVRECSVPFGSLLGSPAAVRDDAASFRDRGAAENGQQQRNELEAVKLHASARLAPGRPGRRWSQVLSEAAAAASRGDEVLLLSTGEPGRRGVKVFIITLPHRADRRVEPLVGSSAAVAAMRDEGFDVEILRASCYCERDRLNERGSVSCHAGGLQPIRMRRYEGASVPLGGVGADAAVHRRQLSGADRLIMEGAGREGTVEGYIVDSNWPGATGHIRAMVEAALAGFEFALVFEDDAVVPADVAREAGETDGLLRPKPGGCMRFFMGGGSDSDSEEDLGGVTELGYTWHAQALMYSRAALDDVLRLRLWEQIWAHDETIPHLYGRRPWNHRYVDALRKAGWERRWIAGAPTDFLEDEGWVLQLESFTLDDDGNPLPTGDLGLGSAWKSSNSAEF